MDTAERTARLFARAWAARASAIPGGEVHEVDGLLVVLTKIPVDQFNVALVDRRPADMEGAIGAAAALFEANGLRFGLDLDAVLHADLRAVAQRMGMRVAEARSAMAASPTRVPALRPPWGVDLVRGEDLLGELARVDAEAFGGSAEAARRFMPDQAFSREGSDPGARAYAAILEGRVVGAAETYCEDGVLGVFGVAVVPGARGRGIGSAITAFAVRDRAPHADLAVLQTSPVACKLYGELGFEEGNLWEVWSFPDA